MPQAALRSDERKPIVVGGVLAGNSTGVIVGDDGIAAGMGIPDSVVAQPSGGQRHTSVVAGIAR